MAFSIKKTLFARSTYFPSKKSFQKNTTNYLYRFIYRPLFLGSDMTDHHT